MPDVEFITLIDRTYRWFPPAHERDSIGIDLPNSHYDPDLGQQILEEVVAGAQRAERLGFDAVSFFEQHNTPLALIPNALTGAAWVAAKTSGIKVAAIGPLLNAYQSPIRLAEEVAMIDTLSGGRLILGLPLGIGAQYHSMGTMSPITARARYREAVALLDKSWKTEGPFAWEGDFFNIPYVNPWPKPRQSPHPEIFIPAAGSRETIELAARYNYTYQAVLTPMPVLLKNCQLFRDLRAEHGYPDDPRKIAAVVSVHVSETDEKAREELERYALWGVQNIIRFQFHESFPPGHVTETSFRAMMDGGYRSSDPSTLTWDQLNAGGLNGSAATVTENLEKLVSAMGAGRVIIAQEFTVPMWLQEKSMTLFAEEVIPHFRPAGALPTWQRERYQGYRTQTELIGRNPRRAGHLTVGIDGVYEPVSDRDFD